MADLQTLLDATAAQERIWAIPGVRRIGFGLKETNGEVLPQWVFRVYVAAKRPAEELKAEELIPPSLEGFETDVLVDHETSLECGPDLHPGQEITVSGPHIGASAGTLGCLVQKGGQFLVLTCCHVIDLGSGEEESYQPGCCDIRELFGCSHPIGKAGEKFEDKLSLTIDNESRDYWVDGGLVPLNHGYSLANGLSSGSLAPQIRDLSIESLTAPVLKTGVRAPTPLVEISKEGSSTDSTTGTVVEVCGAEREYENGPVALLWRLISSPTKDKGVAVDVTREISADETKTPEEIIKLFEKEPITVSQPDRNNHPRLLNFKGIRFSAEGDSGAIWYDKDRRPVGLHYAGTAIPLHFKREGLVEVPTGRGKACHLSAVFSKLGLDPTTGIVSGTNTSAGATMLVPAAIPGPPAEIERELGRSEAGRALLVAVRGSQEEVRKLIDHRRRVTLVWHRHEGPAFVATAINLGREGRTEIPQEVAGTRAADLVEAMLDVLEREGSAELRATVARLRPLLLDLVESCADLDAVVARLDGEPSGVA